MNATAILRLVPVFAPLSEEEVGALANHARVVAYRSRARVARAGNKQTSVLVVAAGRLGLYRREPGGQTLKRAGTIEAGTVFGDAELMARQPWTRTIRALENSTCVHLDKAAWDAIVLRNPRMLRSLYERTCQRFLSCQETMVKVMTSSATMRLLDLLLDYGERFGQSRGDALLLSQPETRRDLAALLGTTRRTVYESLKQLESKGLVSRDRSSRSWRIHDRGVAQSHLAERAGEFRDGVTPARPQSGHAAVEIEQAI